MRVENNPLSSSGPSPKGAHRSKRLKLLMSSLTLGAIAVVLAVWSAAQPAQQTPLDPAVERELARLAILDPAGFEAELNKSKTPEDVLAEQIAAFAILHPAAYAAEAERFKSDEQRRQEALSRMAILEPAQYNALVEKLKTAEDKQREAQAAFAIMNPQPPPAPPAGAGANSSPAQP